MVKSILAATVLLISALLVVYVASEVLQAWTVRANDQGQLIKPHWVDRPEIGMIV